MKTPFEELGLRAWADPNEIRAAYRALVKQCHPDAVLDPAQKEAAQQRMIQLNLAYEEALRLASPRQHAAYAQELPKADALALADRQLAKGHTEYALRQLMRSDSRDGSWFCMYGRVLMAMEQHHEAHLAFREAVRLDPENNSYRSLALDAAMAEKKEQTLAGRARKWFRRFGKK
ncbi:MAG: J domain-containing protein [Clostridia bacterium]|nr:J domain-containing protein [Clostridia bacterium]